MGEIINLNINPIDVIHNIDFPFHFYLKHYAIILIVIRMRDYN